MVTFVNLWKDRQGMLFVEMHVSFISSFYFCLFIFAFLFLRLVPFFFGCWAVQRGRGYRVFFVDCMLLLFSAMR